MNRKIMRSASLLIIIAAVLMCVVSCGGKKSSSESKKPTTTAATVQQTEEQTEIESAAEKVSETETAAPTEAATKGKSKKEKKQKSTKSAQPTTAAPTTETFTEMQEDGSYVEYHFRSHKLLNQHFEKHGGEFRKDFGYQNAEEYEQGASDVINNPDALHKTEAEDGDGVYYIEATNEFVILSTDGYIRTYFRPNGGLDYYNRQ